MERLEISIIEFKRLNAEYRFEAEYFSKYNLNMMRLLKSKPYKYIGNFSDVTDGIHTSIDYDEDSPVNLISATSPRNNYFDLSRNAKISEKAHSLNPRTALRYGDVILSTVGTIGNCAVVSKDILPANSDRHVGIIRVNRDYSPYVVSTYLLSKYGRMQTQRETTGNVQPNLFLYKIREMVIPEYDEKIQKLVKEKVVAATMKRNKAHKMFKEAERIIMDELDVDNWNINDTKYSIRTLKTVNQFGRMDSEYFQLKYDDFYTNIKSYRSGYTTPGEMFDHIKTPRQSGLEMYNYIEIGDVDISNGSYECRCLPERDLPANAKIQTKKGDILVSTVRPYRGAVSIIKENDIVVSGAFTVLRPQNIYPSETLQVLLRTDLYKEWFLKFNVGTSYPVIRDEDVLGIAIPLFDDMIHSQIKELVKKANELLSDANKEYDLAKCIIETATENDVEEALKLVNDCCSLK